MKKIFFLISLLIVNFLLAAKVWAVCPLCTVAVAAGIGLSRWLKIDDVITGLWLGALLFSLSVLTLRWLAKKNVHFRGLTSLVLLIYYLIVILPLLLTDIIGHPLNKIWGIDRLIFGIVIGSIFFVLANLLNSWLKKKNSGRVYFPLQRVIIPVVILIILSLIFYFLL